MGSWAVAIVNDWQWDTSSEPNKVAFILKNSKGGTFNPLNTFTTYFLIKLKLYFNDNEEVNFIYVALSGPFFEKLAF
jgi:hypothetical protein